MGTPGDCSDDENVAALWSCFDVKLTVELVFGL